MQNHISIFLSSPAELILTELEGCELWKALQGLPFQDPYEVGTEVQAPEAGHEVDGLGNLCQEVVVESQVLEGQGAVLEGGGVQ